MASARGTKEFAPGEAAEAKAYIDGLPADVKRVYVEEWDGRGWRFVFGDDREHVAKGLSRLKDGRRFRIRVG